MGASGEDGYLSADDAKPPKNEGSARKMTYPSGSIYPQKTAAQVAKATAAANAGAERNRAADRNYYGDRITPAEYFDGAHDVAFIGAAGEPPVCACGWTRFRGSDGNYFELADHLADCDSA